MSIICQSVLYFDILTYINELQCLAPTIIKWYLVFWIIFGLTVNDVQSPQEVPSGTQICRPSSGQEAELLVSLTHLVLKAVWAWWVARIHMNVLYSSWLHIFSLFDIFGLRVCVCWHFRTWMTVIGRTVFTRLLCLGWWTPASLRMSAWALSC